MSDFEGTDQDDERWDDDYGEAEPDDAEWDSRSQQRGGRPPVRRASQQGSATSGIQGRQFGVVRTPQGEARIELPGKFPTVDEFKQTIAKLQTDIKANSAGIGQLTDRLKGDSQFEASSRTRSVRALRRSLKRTQWAALLAVAVPLVLEVTRPSAARAFQGGA